MSRLYETAAVLVLVAVVVYGLVRVVSALLYSYVGGYLSMQPEASSTFWHLLRATAAIAVAHLSHHNSIRLSVCYTGDSVKNGAS